MWLDQEIMEMIIYTSQFTVNQHFMNLINMFEQNINICVKILRPYKNMASPRNG